MHPGNWKLATGNWRWQLQPQNKCGRNQRDSGIRGCAGPRKLKKKKIKHNRGEKIVAAVRVAAAEAGGQQDTGSGYGQQQDIATPASQASCCSVLSPAAADALRLSSLPISSIIFGRPPNPLGPGRPFPPFAVVVPWLFSFLAGPMRLMCDLSGV